MHTHALLHGGHGTDVISHIFQGSPDDAVAYLRVVLTHLATLSVTVPLAIGVGSLLGWHVHIVRQVRIPLSRMLLRLDTQWQLHQACWRGSACEQLNGGCRTRQRWSTTKA